MLQILQLLVKIEWTKFKVGTSFFVPCLNRKEVADYILKETGRLRFKVICKHVIERHRYGLRVWRIE
jgi:hypothetical protein